MGLDQNGGTSVPPSEPKLCANGCGFFGTATNMYLCSKCYRNLHTKEEQAASAKAVVDKTFGPQTHLLIKPTQVEFIHPVVGLDNSPSDLSLEQKVESSSSILVKPSDLSLEQKVQSSSSILEEPSELSGSSVVIRCGSCDKKLGLMGFKCKCGSTFCSNHRYPENHECGFDYKGDGRAKIASHNPVVKADKLERI